MLESLQDRLSKTLQTLRGEGRLSEYHIDTALKEIRLALLGADASIEAVNPFIERIRARSLDKEVLSSITPAQMVTRIVHDELVTLLGSKSAVLDLKGRPAVLMMVGLQGSGKTTSAAKIAKWARDKKNLFPFLVPADTSRPAAREQLMILAESAGIPCLDTRDMDDPIEIAKKAARESKIKGYQLLIFDTAGRLHIDDELMGELGEVKRELKPKHIVFVADSMTGQDAVRSAKAFDDALGISGIVLTKLDGDARGGAALSVAEVVGKPIYFSGVGENIDALEIFHPDRMAGRILGMGDVVTLVEKAALAVDEKKARRLEQKMRSEGMDLEDLRDQLRSIRKMGPLKQVMDMIPGMGQAMRGSGAEMGDEQEGQLKRMDAIISSMTVKERRLPKILNASRKKRIARGSGTSVQEINQLLRQHAQMRKMMKRFGKMNPKKLKRGLGFLR